MDLMIKQLLSSWNSDKNQRTKLQRAYCFVAIFLILLAGLVTLANPELGHGIVRVGIFFAAVYLANAVAWALLNAFVAPRVASYVRAATKKER